MIKGEIYKAVGRQF